MKEEQKPDTIQTFMEYRKVIHSSGSYRTLSRRDKTIAYYVIKYLNRVKEETIKGEFFKVVKPEFDSYVDKAHQEKNNIKKDKDFYWVLHKNKNTKQQKKSYLTSTAFASVIDKLSPAFVNLKTVRNKSNIGQSHKISLSSKGKELYERWVKQNQ